MKITEENKNDLFIEFCDMEANEEMCISKDAFKEAVTKALILYGVVSSAKNKEAIISEMKTMTDDERLDIITEFCKYCGDLDSGCQCWNDE